MALRVILIASGVIAVLFGGLMLFAADSTIQSFELGASDVASRLFTRAEGSSLIAVGIINLMASVDRTRSAALRAIVVGNIFVHVMGILIDFTETFPKVTGWYVGQTIHVVFILAFGWVLLNWNRPMAAAAS